MKAEKRLLIVDDHSVVREGLRGLIDREADLCVFAEADGVAGALLSCAESLPDGVVVDLALGKDSGLELIEQLRQRYPTLPILVLSMHAESLYAERALRAGANGYVMKQEATSHLLEALRQVLGGNMFVSRPVADRMLRALSTHGVTPRPTDIESLSNRELEVFRLVGMGLGTVLIGAQLRISHKTVEAHRARIKEKLGLHTSNELIVRAAIWVNEHRQEGRASGAR